MDSNYSGGKIHILPPSVSQKIAAGEVIERPQALVRELLDNAIDAGATQIDVFLEDGGNALVAVHDNGCGMNRLDLEISWLPHSTSKIQTIDDLYNITTLGFRGEALSSMASVSLLSMYSHDGTEGGKLIIDGGKSQSLVPWSGQRGTRIEVRNLFYNLPARKQFLKRSSTEGQLCKQTFVEKALSHPGIGFRLYKDNKQELFLPARQNKPLLERYQDLHHDTPVQALFEVKHQDRDFSFSVIAARPEWFRNDRKNILVFLNNRRIQEFGLLQAIEYAYEGIMPGGRYPVAALYLHVDPRFVDVNIHPAKKEVKILNYSVIHSAIVQNISSVLRFNAAHNSSSKQSSSPEAHLLHGFDMVPPQKSSSNLLAERSTYILHQSSGNPSVSEKQILPVFQPHAVSPASCNSSNTKDLPPENTVPEAPSSKVPIVFMGQVFGVFLVFSYNECVWFMDMHAAHERILYDRFKKEAKPQNLLIPRLLDLEQEEVELLVQNKNNLGNIGFRFEVLPQQISMVSMPSIPSCTYEGILESLQKMLKGKTGLEKFFFADLACKAAIKDGEVLDRETAEQLIRQALDLPDQHCPHGRPIFISMSKTSLWEAIGRTV